jgi:hypothetical protein
LKRQILKVLAEMIIQNSKVVGSSPTPATISSIDSKTYVDNSLLPGLVDLNDESFIYSAHVGRKLFIETVRPKLPSLEIRRAYMHIYRQEIG